MIKTLTMQFVSQKRYIETMEYYLLYYKHMILLLLLLPIATTSSSVSLPLTRSGRVEIPSLTRSACGLTLSYKNPMAIFMNNIENYEKIYETPERIIDSFGKFVFRKKVYKIL